MVDGANLERTYLIQRDLTGHNGAQQAATSPENAFPLVRGLEHLTGGQGVAGSNPVVPTVGESPGELVERPGHRGSRSFQDLVDCRAKRHDREVLYGAKLERAAPGRIARSVT